MSADALPGALGAELRLPIASADMQAEAGGAEELELARAAKGGDRTAFARLYERFAPAVHGILIASAPRAEARDLVQEVFLLALRSIQRLDDPGRVGPWLCTIARNLSRDAHKRTRSRAEVDEQWPAPQAAGDGGDHEEAARALQALRELPECYREPLSMRLVEGLSGPEISARTGLTHGSVRVNLCRGMKLLREKLAEGGIR